MAPNRPKGGHRQGCLAAMLAVACTCVAADDIPSVATFVALSASVVRVEVVRQQGGLGIGTGVTVAPSIIVTNCHVTREASAIQVSAAGTRWTVTGEYADTDHDVCFLRAPQWSGRPVQLGDPNTLHPGQDIAALGFSGGASISFRVGHIRALHNVDDGQIIESDTVFSGGSSGGGLFNASGALIGLLTFRLAGIGHNYYSVPVRWIRDRLPKDDQWSDVGPLPGAPFWQGSVDTLPYFLRVAPLDAQGRWDEILRLADSWASAYPADAEALLVRGKALQKLNFPRAARDAFNAALKLAPDEPAAWYGLALASALAGDATMSRYAETKLESLDQRLAAELEKELGEGAGER